jgi:hypothetical protein
MVRSCRILVALLQAVIEDPNLAVKIIGYEYFGGKGDVGRILMGVENPA